MQKVLSWIFMFLTAGLFFTVFLYVASIVIPLLLLVAVFGFWWIRYKQQKALKLSDDVGLRQRRRRPQGEIIDAEYEIINDDKR